MSKEKKSGKKAGPVVFNVFTCIVAVVAIAVMIFTIVSVTTFDKADRDLFGYKGFIVLSDSMSKTDFDAGDLVLVKEVDPATLQEGDIISYQSTNAHNFGDVVTHKIREVTTDENGNPGFVTYGTTTDTNDENIVTYEYVIGKYVKSIPNVGTFFHFLKTVPGYFVCIFIPFMLLIIPQAVNTVKLFRRYRDEQMGSIKEERKQLAAEKEESEKMKEELAMLKAQLAEQQRTPEPKPEPVPEPIPIPELKVKVTEEQIQALMEKHDLTREQVISVIVKKYGVNC